MQQYQEYSVRDREQAYEFSGVLLAESSSRVGNRGRWVEFKLYRTPRGVYVLSRIGASIYFHSGDCEVVERNKLSEVARERVPAVYVPCPDCQPSRMDPEGIYPETPRYWALHTDDPQQVIKNLKKYDKEGIGYLTHVASRLLVTASKNDERIREAFYVVRIE
jgi:hypothetical protein